MREKRVGGEEREGEEAPLLFETKRGKGRGAYKLFSCTIFAGICMIWVYRVREMVLMREEGRRSWIGFGIIGINIIMLLAEVCFGLYWIITQSPRWTLLYHTPFKHILSQRYGEDKLPSVDIFVCTADPLLEPPSMVISTVLSAMSYNYPSNKLSVYLSDDGASDLTFFALLKASLFAKHWIPFCKTFNIEPRSPEAYFSHQKYHPPHTTTLDLHNDQQWSSIKKLYEDMKSEIESAMEKGRVPDEVRNQHKGFSEWNAQTTKQDHQSIVQIIIDGRDSNAVDDDGLQLPTLVYMAREKRPNFPHHFKAGAMNALIRVSSKISNAPIILNLDCDMYPNNADIIQEALCFFMDETRGHQIGYVQFPQNFNNITKNDLYANFQPVVNEIELPGICGQGATLYCGTGCFHRRESLCGMHMKDFIAKGDMKPKKDTEDKTRVIEEVIEASKAVSSCTYEMGSQWGKEMGLVYGIAVEDVATGLVISCRGWKSIYYNPKRKAFVGVAPTRLDVILVQHKRWSEGLFQIFLKYCPFIYGHNKLSFGVQMGYSIYLLWAPLSLPTLTYAILPPIYTVHAIPLFPPVKSPWTLAFLYPFLATHVYSLVEAITCGCTIREWWNLQRMKTFRRTSSHFLGFIDAIKIHVGLSKSDFHVTDKAISSEDNLKIYEQEQFNFQTCSPSVSLMFAVLAALAWLNLFGAVVGAVKLLPNQDHADVALQTMLCVLMLVFNKPVYEALLIRRRQTNRMIGLPLNVILNSFLLASLPFILIPTFNFISSLIYQT